MPLTTKGEKIMSAMKKEYGKEKGEQVFYASKNAGKISGVDSSRADMTDPEWQELRKLLSEWIGEEAAEPEHKADASPSKKLDMLLKGVSHLHRRMMRADAALGDMADRLERNDASWERGLEDDEPRVVSGVKGAKSKPFKKRFPNQRAMVRWMESPEAEDFEVQYVERA